MTEYNWLTFSRTLFHANSFRLKLFRAFFDAWFAQKKFLTELNSPFSAVHYSFATIFQYPNFVQFRWYSKLKLSYGCSLQWWKPFVDLLFLLWEIGKQLLGNFKKTAIFLSSESVNMLLRGFVEAVRVVRNHSKFTSICIFFIYTKLFPLRFQFLALLK